MLALMAAALKIRRLMYPSSQAGWFSLSVFIWLVGAIIINCMVIIGLYVAKEFEQVK